MTLRTLFVGLRDRLRARPEAFVFGLIFAVHLGRYIAQVPRDYYPGGDGYYIYMLARSMAWDFDIELTNEYATCGDPWSMGKDFGTGHPSNPWFIGPAVIWAPVLFVLRHVMPLPEGAPEAWSFGCRGPLLYALGTIAPLFVTATVYLGHRLALRYVSRGVSLTAAVVVAFGSLLAVFGPMWWNYSHVWAAASLTLAALAYVRCTEAPERVTRWVAVGAAIGFAALMRPHHALWMATPGLFTAWRVLDAAGQRRVPWREASLGLAALVAFGAVFYVRLGSYDYMYGSPWPPVLRAVYIQPWHAHPFLLLFSARAGLVAYAPLSWLALVGLGLFVAGRRPGVVVVPLTVGLLLDFWLCSSPLDWAGGATVGPRLLTSFTGVFVLFTALSLDRLHAFATRSQQRLLRLAAFGWLAPLLVLSWQLTEGNGPYDAPSLYGSATRRLLDDVNRIVGNPFTFPAPLVFAARYRSPPADFDRVARDGLFIHDFERGRLLGRERFVFSRPDPEVVLREGFDDTEFGKRLRAGRRGRFLVPLAWPYVSAVELDLANPVNRGDCRLRVENHGFFTSDHGSAGIGRGATRVRVPMPAGAYDSGINETVLVSNCSLDLSVFRFIDESTANTETFLPHYRADPRFH